MDDRGRIIPWRRDEVIDAMQPMVKSIAHQYTEGEWQQPVFDFDDARSLGNMGVLDALNVDEGRPRVGFPTLAQKLVLKNITQGRAIGGWEYRKARGFLDDLKSLTSTKTRKPTIDEVEALATGKIPGKSGISRPDLFTTPDKNEYKDIAPELQELVSDVKRSIEAQDFRRLESLRRKMDEMKDEISEKEKERLPGAKTSGATSGIRTSHGAAPVFATGMEVRRPSGEVEERPVAAIGPSPPELAARKETLEALMDRTPLTAGEGMVLRRAYGLEEYPNKGTKTDPEIDPKSLSGKTRWATPKDQAWKVEKGEELMGYEYGGVGEPHPESKEVNMTNTEIAADLGISKVRVGQLLRKALTKLQSTAAKLQEFTESIADFRSLRSARISLIQHILLETYNEPMLPIV